MDYQTVCDGALLCCAEKRLADAGYLESHSRNYFSRQTGFGRYNIEDDHVPFLRLGKWVVVVVCVCGRGMVCKNFGYTQLEVVAS